MSPSPANNLTSHTKLLYIGASRQVCTKAPSRELIASVHTCLENKTDVCSWCPFLPGHLGIVLTDQAPAESEPGVSRVLVWTGCLCRHLGELQRSGHPISESPSDAQLLPSSCGLSSLTGEMRPPGELDSQKALGIVLGL